MYSSILNFSRSGAPRFAGFWREAFHSLCPSSTNNSNFKVIDSRTYGLEGGCSARWICQLVSTKRGGRRKKTDECSDIRNEELVEALSATATVHVNRTKVTELRKIEYCNSQQKLADNKELVSPVTTIVFDIETTGLSRENERIIEIAFRDLSGGENSTFQTLVNPQRYVTNPRVHGITTNMVNRPNVPRYSTWLLEIGYRERHPPNYWFSVSACSCSLDFIFSAPQNSSLARNPSLAYLFPLAGKGGPGLAWVVCLVFWCLYW